ncbi:MAG: hypothetical protein JWR80_9458 [Bradyrhizobium sp.]|nr:hypothetical protein [Bradyrhizobium sp.]
MSASIFLDYDCDAIQAAAAVALLHFKNANSLTLKMIAKEIEREPQSVHQYISGGAEMPMSCWLKAAAKWPELEDRLIFNLDEAEKAFRAKQRSLRLDGPQPEARAA